MLKVKKIAVTGGLAAGKTTVCKFFEEFGAYIVSADEIVHQLLSPDSIIGQQIVSLLGLKVVNGAQFDRKKIAAEVFSQPPLLHALEELIHPAVFNEIEQRYNWVNQEKKHPLFIAEIPLLYESKGEGRFDGVISVFTDPTLSKKRFILDTHKNAAEFDQRMARQIAPQKKADLAHYTIENNGNLQELKTKVKTLFLQLTN